MSKKAKRRLFILIFFGLGLLGETKGAKALTLITEDITTPTVWSKEHSPYIVRNWIFVGAPMIIEPGTIVKFQNYESDDRPTIPGMSLGEGFSAIGTPSEPIIFTTVCDGEYGGDTSEFCSEWGHDWIGSWSWLSFGDRGIVSSAEYVSFIEYAKIFYAMSGIRYKTGYCALPHKRLSVKHTEISFSGIGIDLTCAQPLLDGLVLRNNYTGINVFDSNSDFPSKIRNSVIVDNREGAYGNGLDARYNYWGDPSGPYYGYDNNGNKEPSNFFGLGNKIIGTNVLFRPWDRSDPTIPKEPVIFVPGIGASINPDLMISGIFNDNWTMFDRTYDGILEAFKAMGYQENKNFFIAYYDWRQSNTQSAEKYLQPLVQKALAANSEASKVNIVTHSMGSLVARSYVQSSAYGNNVDNLIMIAPPNRGSSDVYTLWEGGYIPKNWSNGWVMNVYINYLKLKNLDFSGYDIIHKFIPSLKDLFPVYDFLFPAGATPTLKSSLVLREQNDFLLNLNKTVDDLSAKTRLSIILGDRQPTVDKIPVVDSDQTGLWFDGKPDPLDPVQDAVSGDGEVLRASGDISSDFLDILDYDHGEIVSKSEKIVAERLGEKLEYIFNPPEVEDELIFWTDAPGELDVLDPEWRYAPKDNNEKTNVRYAQEKNKNGFKIISVPNIKKGKYQAVLKASENKQYHLGMEYVDHKNENNSKESLQTLEIKKDQTQHFSIEADPQSETAPIGEIQVKDEIGPTIIFQSPENGKEYASDQIVPIIFSVSDNVSKKEDIWIEKYVDDEFIEGDTLDLSQFSLGNHTFWLETWDQEENWNEVVVSFSIKKAVLPNEPPTEDGENNQNPPGENNETENGGDWDSGNTNPNSTLNSESNSGNQTSTEIVALPTEPVATHKKKNHAKKKEEKKKFIQGGGVTKSNEKIKVLFSSSFNLSTKAEEQQNLFYQNLEENLKAQLVALEENSGQAENLAPKAQPAELLSNFFTPWALGNSERLFNFPEKPTILGATWSENHLVKFAESRSNQENLERIRLILLLEFLLAMLAAIFFVRSFLKNRSKTGKFLVNSVIVYNKNI